MEKKKNWKYCVVGNISKSHVDENGTLRYGTAAFSGGTKVFLCGRFWNPTGNTIEVAGLSRGKCYYVDTVPVHLIENVRPSRAYKPAVLEIMGDWEHADLWWHNTREDKQATEDFVVKWNEAVNKG